MSSADSCRRGSPACTHAKMKGSSSGQPRSSYVPLASSATVSHTCAGRHPRRPLRSWRSLPSAPLHKSHAVEQPLENLAPNPVVPILQLMHTQCTSIAGLQCSTCILCCTLQPALVRLDDTAKLPDCGRRCLLAGGLAPALTPLTGTHRRREQMAHPRSKVGCSAATYADQSFAPSSLPNHVVGWHCSHDAAARSASRARCPVCRGYGMLRQQYTVEAAGLAFLVMVRSFSSLTQLSSSALMTACNQHYNTEQCAWPSASGSTRPSPSGIPGRWACTGATEKGRPWSGPAV